MIPREIIKITLLAIDSIPLRLKRSATIPSSSEVETRSREEKRAQSRNLKPGSDSIRTRL
jgi:hypothetical protein